MNFQNSTHRMRWLYSKQALEDIRQCLNQEAIEKITRCAAEEPDSEGSRKLGESAPISPDEERRLLKYYQSHIPEICRSLRLDKKVEATALVYLKRFYTSHSCMDFDPQRIMLTCIYLACKIEEWYTSAEDICRKFGHTDGTPVLRNEVVLLQGLHFDLVVHSPYRALAGFITDVEACRLEGASSGIDEAILNASEKDLEEAKKAALASCDALMLSDAPLVHTPGQIALAALRSGYKRHSIRMPLFMSRVANRAAAQAQPSGPTPHNISGRADSGLGSGTTATKPPANPVAALHKALDEIDQLGIAGAEKADMAEAAAIDRRLKMWRNPLLDPNSAAYKRAALADDRERAERREAKLRSRQEAKTASEAALLGHVPANA